MLISHPATVAVARPSEPTPDLTTSLGRSLGRSVGRRGNLAMCAPSTSTNPLPRSFGCPLLMMRLTSGKTHVVGHVADDVHTGISVRWDVREDYGLTLLIPTVNPPHHHV